jgi:DNA-3-methyladenine glycosylase II
MKKTTKTKTPTFHSLFTDPVMIEIHQRVHGHFGELPLITPRPSENYFWDLCESIIGQQLSEKVAPQIVKRAKAVLGDDLTPTKVLATEDMKLREAGLSFSKISYLKNLATFWQENKILPTTFSEMESEEIIVHLTQVKGIGRWTVEMFLLFTLGRPDVFSTGDYGLRRAILRAYQLSEKTTPKEIGVLAENWQPHRSLASRLLWKSLDIPEEK